MKKDRVCKYCNISFENENGKAFSNHVRWCDKNTTNGDKGRAAAKLALRKSIEAEKGLLTFFEVKCTKCEKIFLTEEWSKLHPQKDIYFCSRSCANKRGPRSEEFKKKISKKWNEKSFEEKIDIQLKRKENEHLTREDFLKKRICAVCENSFVVYYKNKDDTCSNECGLKKKEITEKERIKKAFNSIKAYRQLCSFRFSIKDYPDEFDMELIKKHGWYAAKNRGDNPGGVSRDHIISVFYGFKHNIDPNIISHPANCKLMCQPDNFIKREKCDITIDELLEKISKWNKKYNVV